MGEYVKWDGQTVKIGTCEDLGYTTFVDYCRALSEGRLEKEAGNEDPAEYIQGEYRFRFPVLPDTAPGQPKDLDAGIQIAVPKELGLGTDQHISLSHSLTPAGQLGTIYGFNLLYPCPADKKFDLKTSPNTLQSQDILVISQQRPLQGLLWTVVDCAWCRSKWRLTPEEAVKLTDHIRKVKTGDDAVFWGRVCLEILGGYTKDNLCAQMVAAGFIKDQTIAEPA